MPSAILLAHLALATNGIQSIDASRVVDESNALLQSARTIQGRYVAVSDNGGVGQVDFILERPNNVVLRSRDRLEIFGGQTSYVITGNTYQRRAVDLYGSPYVFGLTGFFNQRVLALKGINLPQFEKPQVVEVEGKSYVRLTSADGKSYDINPETKLPERWSWPVGGARYSARFENLRLNVSVPNSVFDTDAATAGKTYVPTPEEAALIPLGQPAPRLRTQLTDGREFDLGQFLAKKRGAVVAFIDPKSQRSADGVKALVALLKGRKMFDVGVVFVSTNADSNALKKVYVHTGMTPPTIVGSSAAMAANDYGVSIRPTFYLVDSAGIIRGASIGYDSTLIGDVLTAMSPN